MPFALLLCTLIACISSLATVVAQVPLMPEHELLVKFTVVVAVAVQWQSFSNSQKVQVEAPHVAWQAN